jgi:hypothetical protein
LPAILQVCFADEHRRDSLTRCTDIVLVRMTSDSVRPPGNRYNYRNAAMALVQLVKEERFKGLSRGMGTNVVSVNMCQKVMVV